MIKWLDQGIKGIGILLFGLLVILTVVQVASRLIGSPVQGTDEAVRFLFIWLVFLGIAYGMREKVHIEVDFFANKFGDRFQYGLTLFNHVLMIAYTSVIIYQGFKVTVVMGNQLAPISRIPMSYIFAAIPIGGILLLFYIVLSATETIKERKR
jgi:TRAP-type C4-dicarboxylate transport system permease small subunit